MAEEIFCGYLKTFNRQETYHRVGMGRSWAICSWALCRVPWPRQVCWSTVRREQAFFQVLQWRLLMPRSSCSGEASIGSQATACQYCSGAGEKGHGGCARWQRAPGFGLQGWDFWSGGMWCGSQGKMGYVFGQYGINMGGRRPGLGSAASKSLNLASSSLRTPKL